MSGTGVVTRPYLDAGEGTITAHSTQDCEDIIENNKRLQSEPQTFAGHGDAKWHHLCSIPNIVILKWMYEDEVNLYSMCGDEFAAFIKRKLRDPDNAWLRTTNKRF